MCKKKKEKRNVWAWGQNASTYVGNTDSLGLASRRELLHQLPRVDVVVGVNDVPRAVGVLGELLIVA